MAAPTADTHNEIHFLRALSVISIIFFYNPILANGLEFVIIEPTPAGTPALTCKTPFSISEALITGKDLSVFMKNITAYEAVDYNVWKWFQLVIEECVNCRTVTTRDIFCDGKECDFIDRNSNLGLYCDDGHITPRTSFKLVEKLINAIID